MLSKQRIWLCGLIAVIGCEKPAPPAPPPAKPLPAEVTGDPASALPPRVRSLNKNKR